jgi:hypothetical protein
MKAVLAPPPTLGIETPHEELNFVVIYESFATAVRARKLCEQLAGKLGAPCKLEDRLWRTDVLTLSSVKTEAAEAALHATFVVLSLTGKTALPPTIASWLEGWMPRAAESRLSLVAFFDPATARLEPMNATSRYLHETAASNGIDFFAARASG